MSKPVARGVLRSLRSLRMTAGLRAPHTCLDMLSGTLLRVLLGMVLLLIAHRVHAAPPSEMRAWTDTEVVAVGEDLEVHLKVSASGEVSDVELSADPHVTQVGRPTVGSFHEMNIRNGAMVQKQGVNVTFRLNAAKLGTATVRPTITIGGRRVTAGPVTIRIVQPSQAPPRRPRASQDPFGGNPLDPFGGLRGLFGNPFGDDQDEPRMAPRGLIDIPTDPRYGLDAPRNKGIFLHAGIDKTQAVIGEQVTLSIYEYIDATIAREPDFNDVHDASTSDFVRRPLLEESTNPKVIGHARVGGRIWAVRLLRKMALFPIKAGDLEIGPMSLAVVSSAGGITDKRESETLKVHVTEPPAAGRPPGYTMGDVGRFELAATVEPREIAHGGIASVTLELSGTGNLPSSIVPPARQGIEWLPPEVKEKMGKEEGDRYGGKRTFNYVLRITRDGTIDLGEVAIPFYDPDTRAYSVARAPLGTVLVNPGGAAGASTAGSTDPLPNLPPARRTRAEAKSARSHLTDLRGFWLALAAPSLSFVVFAGGRAAARRLKDRVRTRNASPDTVLKQRMQDAETACARTDPRAADATIARALEHATIVRVQVNVRAIATRQIAATLIENKVAEPLARAIEDLLAECESARFAPSESDISISRERWKRAKECISQLRKG